MNDTCVCVCTRLNSFRCLWTEPVFRRSVSFIPESAMAAAAAVASDTAETQAAANRWGVSFEEAQEYLDHASGTGSYFATAIAFPFHHAVHGPGVFARDGMDASPTAAWPPFNVYSESERGGLQNPCFLCLQVLLCSSIGCFLCLPTPHWYFKAHCGFQTCMLKRRLAACDAAFAPVPAQVAMAVSTPESTRVEHDHHLADTLGVVFNDASWCKYQVWKFNDMNILNFSGILTAAHQGTCIGPLDQFLDREYSHLQWREKYLLIIAGQSYRHGLRNLLADMGSQYWIEMEFGTSYRGYRCLDAYISIFHPRMPPPPSSAWYLLNDSIPVGDRELYLPEYWYYCNDWKSIGQRPSIQEWEVQARAAMVRVPPAQRQAAERRMMVNLGHIAPAPVRPPQGMIEAPSPGIIALPPPGAPSASQGAVRPSQL